MTDTLVSKTCTPCRGGIPPLTREQAEVFHAQTPDWQLRDEAHRIERRFWFSNFREALTFVQEVGELAEAEGHHPDISFGWGNATVSLQTKKIKGLHETTWTCGNVVADRRAAICQRCWRSKRFVRNAAGRPLQTVLMSRTASPFSRSPRS